MLDGVALNAAGTFVQNIQLGVGPVAESVTVHARESLVETANSEGSQTVVLKDIEVLPQLERNPIVLAIFQPGVQIRGGNIGFSRINGTRQGSNGVRVDAINATETINPLLAVSGNLTTTDSIQEFRIVTHSGNAEYGNNAGAQVDMVTRSGASRWSGNVFEYFRNTALNANDFFNNSSGIARPKFNQSIFGASAGGPLLRSRTFLFATFQSTRTRQELVRNRTVLTAPARAGLFRWIPPGNTAIQPFDIVRADPRGKGIDPQIATLLQLVPAANNFDIGDGLNYAGYRFNNNFNSSQDGFNIRTDHQLRNRIRLFLRASWFRAEYIDAQNNADAPFPGQPEGTAQVNASGYSAGADWTITAAMTNEVRFGRNGLPRDQIRPGRLPGAHADSEHLDQPIECSVRDSVAAPAQEWTDHFSAVRGRHALKAGLIWRFTNLSSISENGIYPDVFFWAELRKHRSCFHRSPGGDHLGRRPHAV